MSASSRSRPISGLGCAGRFVARSVLSGGNSSSPSWNSGCGADKSLSRCAPSGRSLSPSSREAVRSERTTCPPVGGGADACPPMDVHAGIALGPHDWLARMQAHADAQGALGELRLCFGGNASRLTGVGEDDEEGIALRVNLEPAVAGESRAQDPVVLGERLHIAGPELL